MATRDRGKSNVATLSPDDRRVLARAKQLLERPGIPIQAANLLGAPVEYILRVPVAGKIVDQATHVALNACSRAALKTLRDPDVSRRPRNGWHRFAVATTGAVGGFFGIVGASIELPVTTTTMLRAIAAIASSHGEYIDAPDTRLACLEVLALGGRSKSDDTAGTGYFAIRAALAQQVSAAANHLTSGGLAEEGAPAIVALINRIAAYFAIPVSEKLAIEAVPVISAALGSTINVIFISHFQRMAEGHFTIRQLERTYWRRYRQGPLRLGVTRS